MWLVGSSSAQLQSYASGCKTILELCRSITTGPTPIQFRAQLHTSPLSDLKPGWGLQPPLCFVRISWARLSQWWVAAGDGLCVHEVGARHCQHVMSTRSGRTRWLCCELDYRCLYSTFGIYFAGRASLCMFMFRRQASRCLVAQNTGHGSSSARFTRSARARLAPIDFAYSEARCARGVLRSIRD